MTASGGGTVERAMRTSLSWLSHRRTLGRIATKVPFTRPMVDRFVAGESLEEALPALDRTRAAGFHTTVDLLGEAVSHEDAANAAADGYLRTIPVLLAHGLDCNVSVKPTQMGLAIGRAVAAGNIGRICDLAGESGGFVRIDMEDHTTTDATLELFRELRPRIRGKGPGGTGDVGVVIQSALRRSAADVEALIAEGARVRLCKGAYKEPASVAYQSRAEVDAAYVRLTERLLADGVYPAIATHDDAMVDAAIRFATDHGIGPERFEFQMLHGIRRDLQERLVAEGWRVRVYVPFGREWWAYFMRRLAERPQNVMFLIRTTLRERRGSASPRR
jgi:proline dehydrogenase